MKELQAKAKVTQTMTRDGLVVENQADGTVENVSSRETEQDYSTDAEGKAEKILERAEDIKDGHKNKKKAKKAAETAATAKSEDGLHRSAARLELTEDERADPELQPYIHKAEAKADNLDLRVRRDHVPYDVWERQGTLQTTEGNVVHYGYIEKFIERLGERFNIREIAFDRWGAVQMVQNLEGMGFTVVPFGQGFKDMSPPTKELMKLVLEEKIAHGGHPVLRWMMDNIFICTDPAGNIKPGKEKSTEKIDGAVATIMALDRAIRCGNDKAESVYDSRGLLFI